MTFALSGPLQAAVYARLGADPALAALVGDAVYDAPPEGPLAQTYVALGPEEVRDRSDVSGAGALHRFTVGVYSDIAGFAAAKAAAAAVCDALTGAALPLSRGRLVGLRFERAAARRLTGGGRAVEMRFAARVEDA